MNFSRDMKSLKNRRKGKAGFTMSELLIVVAIVIVLFAVAVLSLVTIQKNLRQKELDSKAEILYVAVQNRMSELRAGGYESLYQYDENKDNGVAKVGLIPLDAPEEDAEDAITKDTLCYVVSADRVEVGKAAASVLPESSVDAELWNNHWVIEYDPESGSVYSAFYSEEEITSGDASTTLPTYLNRMRVRQTRLHNGAKIGYYGGARVISGTTDTLKPDISIDNREKLTATFYCNNPYADELTFNIKVSDGRNEYVKVVKYSELRQLNSKTWYYTWVMDSLESEKTRFYNQTDHKLACGTDITVTLSVESQNANVDGKSYTRKTNSLFRYAEGTPAGTALIAYGRHLQNLDEASHVSDTITRAVQVSDLSFADDTADNEDWYSFYGDTFTPITNKHLKSYDGYSEVDNVKLYSSISNLYIKKAAQNGDAGLFSTFNGEIKNVTLTGMRIDKGGQNVGALIGSVSDTVKITNTRVYLSSKKGDLADIETVDSPEKVKPWLEGKVVGGLIGMVTKTGSVSVTDSSASTVIRADGAAGGLIGAVYHAATITDSYADCYLTAARTGGLIAKAEGGSEVAETGTSITLKDFYAAGYQTATVDAFGLVGGSNVIATGGYSACVYNVEENAKVHSTVNAMGSASNVYYLTDGGLSGDGTSKWENASQTKPKTYKELSESGFAKGISEAFTSSSGAATFPYNLMDQGLTYYTYPRLEKLNHYGDWQAEFESGALVYYERYEDKTYGFYGANLSTLKTSKFVVGDGYALAYIEKKKETDNVTVTYANDQKAQVSFGSVIETTDDTTNTKYYLYPLSKEVVNTKYIDTAEPDTFYQKITIEDTANSTNTEYYYNPHFAKTVTVNENKPQAPETVCIRSARQLYALSLYYPQYADAVKDSVFRQELNIDYSRYEWTNYDVVPAKINTQAPIGTGDKPFTAVYNGGCNTIEGISFKANSLYIGMFGYTSSAAAVRNVFLVGNGSNTVAYVNAQGGNSASGSASRVSMGVLVGYNRGTVSNCSVSGYTMEYYGYSASTASLGGFVGSNYGTIRNSASDCPSIRFANTNSNTYAGGFAGVNHASISDSYALGSVQVRGARNSTVWVAGFAANNASGMIRRSYSATALTASGDAESYGFTHTGGSAYQCYYLDGGTYSYRGTLYAYNTSKNEFEDNAAGEPLTGSELQNKTINNFKKADCTYNFKETTGDHYIYPAVVRNAAGKTVHYGDWPVQKDIGTLGVFYWEYEDSGSNSGYHFSYVGTSQGNEISSANNDILKGDSLCEEHDDGGVVTHYGYGYFYANSNNLETSLRAEYFNENFMSVAKNAEAGEALGKQMPGYTVSNCYSYMQMPASGSKIVKSSQSIASNGEMQEEFAMVSDGKDHVVIQNCYVLESSAVNTDDYKSYKNESDWSDWKNFNVNHNVRQIGEKFWDSTHGRWVYWYDRRIEVTGQSASPYISYEQMQNGTLLSYLNKNYQSGSSYKSFSTVTITEQGQNIDGKYSFPGNDTALQGLNYPFPTVLTQTDIFGSTVNLHYGRWPRIGLLWEENSQKLDLLADIKTKAEDSTLNDNENGKALLQTHLLVASSDVDTSAEPPEIKLYDENRNELTNDKAAATVSRIAYNDANKCYDVTFIGQNVGTVVAEAKLGNYIARLTIEVTASLKLEASSTNISVYSGDTDTITLTVKDANDKQLLAETEKTLRWEIAVDNNGVQQDVIECSKDDIKLNADGTFSLPLTGFAAGEATVSITCTYPYGAAAAAEPAKEVTATLYIGATTKPSDVLGLTNGSVYNQISLPHTPKKSTTSYTGTTVEYPENGPAMQKSTLFLYATNAYTDLTGSSFTVDQIEITAGETTYTVGKDGITTDENHTYKVTVNDQWMTETNDTKFQYRAVKVESAAAGEITLKIVLKNGDVTYNLTTPYTIVSNEYKVKFVTVNGDLVLEKKVSYGEKPTLTEAEKNKLATAILGYTFDFDNLPEIFADTEIKAVPNTYTIQFNANGGLGTMPDESYAYDKIQTTDSLLPNTFTKGTSAFKGWAVEAEGAVQYTDMNSIQDIVNSMAMGNKTELTLYAVWEDTAAGGETAEP